MASWIFPSLAKSAPLAPSISNSASSDYSFFFWGTGASCMASSIVLTSGEAVSRFTLDYLNYFSGTTIASNSSPTSITVMSYFHNTSARNAVSVWPSIIPDA